MSALVRFGVLQCVVLQCVAVCCSPLECVKRQLYTHSVF